MKKSIIPRIITAYQDDAYRWEIHRAMMDFFDETNKDAIAQQLKENPDVEGWFNEWLIYDFRLENGKTILEDFVERNPLQLSDAELDAYRDLLSSESGFFEILEVKRKKSLRLKSITTDHEYLVSESQGTLGVQERRMIYGRVGRVDGHYELVGSNGIYIDVQLGDRLRKQFLGSGEKVNSRMVYRIMRPDPRKGFSAAAFSENIINDRSEDIDPAQACDALAGVLKDYHLDRYVDVETIQSWIKHLEDSRSRQDFSYITMLMGLLEGTESEEDLTRIFRAVVDVYLITAQDRMDGKSPLQKKEEEPDRPPEIITEEVPLCSKEWIEHSVEAHALMKQGKYEEAVNAFQEAFRSALEDQTTATEIYRLFANAGIAHLLNGDVFLGEKMIDISLELNPNYDFGIQLKQQIQDGKFMPNILQGLSKKMEKNLDDPDLPMNRWNSNKVDGMSTQEIFAQLEAFGISETEETFVEKIGHCATRDAFIDDELYPRFTGEKKDEDFVIHAGLTLIDRLCPDQWFAEDLSEQLGLVYNQVTEDAMDMEALSETFTRIRSFVQAPTLVIDTWKREYFHTSKFFIQACIELLQDRILVDEVLQAAAWLETVSNELIFQIVSLIHELDTFPGKNWRQRLATLSDRYPGDPSPRLFLAFAFSLRGDFAQEEELLLDTLSILQERERAGALGRVSPFDDDLLTAYKEVLDSFVEFYEEYDESQLPLYVSKREAIEQRDDLRTQESLRREAELDQTLLKIEKQQFQKDAGYQYYLYLKKFNIHFATDELTESKRVFFSTGGKKLGRNDPCPCGALNADGLPIKFKKCCGV